MSAFLDFIRGIGGNLGQRLDQNGDGRISSREQTQQFVESLAAMTPEERRTVAQGIQQNLDQTFPPAQRGQLPPERQRDIAAGLDFAQSLADPERFRQFCQAPTRVAATSQALNNYISLMGDSIQRLPQAPPEARAGMNQFLQQFLRENPQLQQLRGNLDFLSRMQMDHYTRSFTVDQLPGALQSLQQGIRDVAPQGFEPITIADACHGLGVPTTPPQPQTNNKPRGR